MLVGRNYSSFLFAEGKSSAKRHTWFSKDLFSNRKEYAKEFVKKTKAKLAVKEGISGRVCVCYGYL